MPINGRALHFVFKIGDRTLSSKFYRDILGMKVLRHEEFTEGCGAKCNGPYDNRWSKTMIGYGVEDTHFVMELTYNYGIDSYELGNDYLGITIRSNQAIRNAKKHGWPIFEENGFSFVQAPGGYKFYLIDDEQPSDRDPVEKIRLACYDLSTSTKYWNETLGLTILDKTDKSIILAFDAHQTKLEMYKIDEQIDHGTAFGRIAFSVPTDELNIINDAIEKGANQVLTPLVSLDTPGKATVVVIILADPDGHEICFVGDEAFRELSKFDEEAESQLDIYIQKDQQRKEENPC